MAGPSFRWHSWQDCRKQEKSPGETLAVGRGAVVGLLGVLCLMTTLEGNLVCWVRILRPTAIDGGDEDEEVLSLG